MRRPMREKLQKELYEKYPEILCNVIETAKTNNSPLAWFGIECGDGWYNIIDTLCKAIQSHLRDLNSVREQDEPRLTCEAVQIKEKFGGLRFYIDGGDEYIHDAIDMAEDASYSVCEYCGSTSDIGRTDGWIVTICKECYDKSEDKRHWHSVKEK